MSAPSRGRGIALVLAFLAIVGCAAQPSGVSFRVVVVGDDPFLGADSIDLRIVRADGSLLLEDRLDPSERSVALGPLPFASEMTLTIETVRIDPMLGPFPLAIGRSFPFTVPGPGSAPLGSPDVTLGLLGLHARALALPAGVRVVAVAPTSFGALLVSETDLVPFLAHGADGRPTLGTAVALPASRLGASFAPLADGLLAVGGAAPGATYFSAGAAILAEIDATDLRASSGVALASLADGAVLSVGGADSAGTPIPDVVRIERTDTGVAVFALAPLRAARSDAHAVTLEAMSTRGVVPRVLVVEGATDLGVADAFVVIDPTDLMPAVEWTPPSAIRRAALAAVDTGQVLVAGGRDALGTVLSDVRVLIVDVERGLAFLSPAPDPGLFQAREDASAIAIAPGVALVLGGVDPGGLPVAATELADVRGIPGSVRPTGPLPAATLTTTAAVLGDRSILVAAGDTLTLYFPYPL